MDDRVAFAISAKVTGYADASVAVLGRGGGQLRETDR